MEWSIITTDCFDEWFGQQDESTQERVLACLIYLRKFGYSLGRPYADTVYQSKFPNMKELRIQNKGKPIRAFYAFDPLRQAIVLCAGEKGKDKRFYEKMIALADAEFTSYLNNLEKENENVRSNAQ
ncbi:TPA: type II toxin-antitoxin system RelE/ParE family toxin [Mannheimia haemolytica]|nr:type II toxin-antitoxin system RelE/ParE family toxin [Mannheimia haemolytica]HDL5141969.1 type II toxin-antitoxin system RelE/ParE family toxin [Mannheimia haemolytica]HDL5906179.1 type II toxin-antitoxin system RelE/ParE family toxin [Mannheimia haemolytica]HEB5580012.1 type II toxin-antitoxin system RelE/ParE family toxin [Mannheimia haemolytica]